MRLPSFPKVSRKLHRTLRNLRVSLLCFLLTFLVLRNTIGAGKFGTPAQDFEEIRLHLRNVGLHRRHVRALAEAVEEDKLPLEASQFPEQGRAPVLSAALKDVEGTPVAASGIGTQGGTAGASWDKGKQGNAGPASFTGMRWNAASLSLDLRHRNVQLPSMMASKVFPVLSPTVAGNTESLRISDGNGKSKAAKPFYQGSSNVVVVASQASSCSLPDDEHLLQKSIRNVLEYSSRSGFEASGIVAAQNRHGSKLLSKISLLQSALQTYAHAEWIWWVPSGAFFVTDLSFALPLQSYMEYNIVLLGAIGASYPQQSMMINLETDSFLIRICQWSVELLQKSADSSIAGGSGPVTITINPEVKESKLATGNALSDQKVQKNARDKVYVERSVVLRGTVEILTPSLEELLSDLPARFARGRLPFITQFLNCKLCQGRSKEEIDKCSKPMQRLLIFVDEEAKRQRLGQKKSVKHSFARQVAI